MWLFETIESQLSVCPFCGQEAEYLIDQHENSDTTHTHKIRCKDVFGCGATMFDSISYYGNYEERIQSFINRWNRRNKREVV